MTDTDKKESNAEPDTSSKELVKKPQKMEKKSKAEQTTSGKHDTHAAKREDDSPQPNSDTTKTDTAPQDKPHRNGIAATVSITALIVAIGATGIGYTTWQNINSQLTELNSQLGQTDLALGNIESSTVASRSQIDSVKYDSNALQQRFSSLEGQIDSRINLLQEKDTAIDSALGALSNAMQSKSNDQWLAAEARHLIVIANHQAQLNYNATTALAALQAADERLREVSAPSLIKVRQTLADDIIALRAINELDITGIALSLSEMEKHVASLPLATTKGEERKASETIKNALDIEPSTTDKIWNKIEEVMDHLFTVRKLDTDQAEALLPPDQLFFLQQNLRLKLEAARVALLQRDTKTFNGSINSAKQWIEHYFDTESANTHTILSGLVPYEGLDLAPPLPDISNALKEIDDWRAQKVSHITNIPEKISMSEVVEQ